MKEYFYLSLEVWELYLIRTLVFPVSLFVKAIREVIYPLHNNTFYFSLIFLDIHVSRDSQEENSLWILEEEYVSQLLMLMRFHIQWDTYIHLSPFDLVRVVEFFLSSTKIVDSIKNISFTLYKKKILSNYIFINNYWQYDTA